MDEQVQDSPDRIPPIRLRSSSTDVAVDYRRLPEPFLLAMAETVRSLADEHDFEAILAFLGYALSGLQTDDIRERLVMFYDHTPTDPSRETVRKLIIKGCTRLREVYIRNNGVTSLSMISLPGEIDIDLGAYDSILQPQEDEDNDQSSSGRKEKEETRPERSGEGEEEA